MTPTRPLVALAAVAGVLVATLGSAPAQALPPTSRIVKDAVEPGAAYDITQISMRSAPKTTRPAVVIVTYAREVKFGDSVDVWFDFDGDKVPDIHLSGSAFSEFTVHKAKSFIKDGKDISDDDAVRLAMAGTTSKIRLFPSRVGSPLSYAVAVKSSSDGKPVSTDDWAPAGQKFTKKVLAAPLT